MCLWLSVFLLVTVSLCLLLSILVFYRIYLCQSISYLCQPIHIFVSRFISLSVDSYPCQSIHIFVSQFISLSVDSYLCQSIHIFVSYCFTVYLSLKIVWLCIPLSFTIYFLSVTYSTYYSMSMFWYVDSRQSKYCHQGRPLLRSLSPVSCHCLSLSITVFCLLLFFLLSGRAFLCLSVPVYTCLI